MLSIISKEIQSFFSGIIGYLVVAIFVVINGLFLWVFKGDFNIFDSGFADVTPFFELAPWVLLFLVPAVCMRAFSDEKKSGTLELLLTKPLTVNQIVFGKYLGAVLLVIIALIPSVLYVFTISELGNPPGNWDLGSTLGSYFGLLFLIFSYSAIGIFSSTLTQSQIAAFIIAIFLCLFFYYGFEGLSTASLDLSGFGFKAHYESISRGVIDSRDLVYFLCVTGFFIGLTSLSLKRQ
ncbi:MAG: gliding motility-associated ABC transporter permease subunit GldF [Bacteroidetes bacterium]|jgi:ABC-2 type transport system permease protein|nr:gliding motility-associated ABC transporter permease subunit GldF [Bacteroidota bacterium]